MWNVILFLKNFRRRLAAQRQMSAILREKKKALELERLVLLSGRGKGLVENGRGRR